MSSSFFPAPNGMKSFWRKDPGPLDNFRSSPELPEESDIVVIGAGYSGAAIVTHLLTSAPSEKKPSILVLEARGLCSGATGRNGGHIKPDSYNAISAYASEYGTEAAAEVANFESENVKAVTEYIRREKVDCDFVLTRAVDVQLSAAHQTQIEESYEKLLAAGVEATQSTFSVSAEGAESMSGIKGAKGCFTYTAGHLWPYKLTHHMFSQAIQQGVNVQTNTSVKSVSSTQDENGKWVLETSRGTTKAKQLIFATNAYTGALLPEYSTKIIPYRGVCCRIKTPRKRPFLNNTYAIRFSDREFDYLIPRLDGSIIVGGAHRTYIRDTKEWYGNVDDTKMMEQARSYFDGYMQRHFIGWEDSGAYVDNIWTGSSSPPLKLPKKQADQATVMGFSSDRLPRVGPIPDRPGMFIMGGFSGHGMPQIFLCARGIAEMVAGEESYKRTGLPRLFEETRARLDDPRDRVREMANPVNSSRL